MVGLKRPNMFSQRGISGEAYPFKEAGVEWQGLCPSTLVSPRLQVREPESNNEISDAVASGDNGSGPPQRGRIIQDSSIDEGICLTEATVADLCRLNPHQSSIASDLLIVDQLEQVVAASAGLFVNRITNGPQDLHAPCLITSDDMVPHQKTLAKTNSSQGFSDCLRSTPESITSIDSTIDSQNQSSDGSPLEPAPSWKGGFLVHQEVSAFNAKRQDDYLEPQLGKCITSSPQTRAVQHSSEGIRNTATQPQTIEGEISPAAGRVVLGTTSKRPRRSRSPCLRQLAAAPKQSYGSCTSFQMENCLSARQGTQRDLPPTRDRGDPCKATAPETVQTHQSHNVESGRATSSLHFEAEVEPSQLVHQLVDVFSDTGCRAAKELAMQLADDLKLNLFFVRDGVSTNSPLTTASAPLTCALDDAASKQLPHPNNGLSTVLASCQLPDTNCLRDNSSAELGTATPASLPVVPTKTSCCLTSPIPVVRFLPGLTLWRECSVGQALVEIVNDMFAETLMTRHACEQLLQIFDRTMVKVIPTVIGSRMNFKITSGHIDRYKNLDGIWVIYIRNLRIKERGATLGSALVRVIAAEAATLKRAWGGERRQGSKVVSRKSDPVRKTGLGISAPRGYLRDPGDATIH